LWKLEETLLEPLSRCLDMLGEILEPFTTDLHAVYRTKTKAGVVRETQLHLHRMEMKDTLTASMSSSTSAPNALSVAVSGNLALFGYPYGASETYFLRPEKRLALSTFASKVPQWHT